MDRTEKAINLIESAQKYGIRLGCDCGMVIVKECGEGDERGREMIIDGLRKYFREVRPLVEARARADAARKFVGQPIWVEEYGDGTLVDASTDGSVTISVSAARESKQTQLRVAAESLLILANKDNLDVPTTQHAEQAVEKPAHRGILGRLRG